MEVCEQTRCEVPYAQDLRAMNGEKIEGKPVRQCNHGANLVSSLLLIILIQVFL